MSLYIVKLDGDIDKNHSLICDEHVYKTLDDALKYVGTLYPDVEDDRVLIFKVDPGKSALVWGFYGWHWEFITEQGKLLGHEDTLYHELHIEYYGTSDLSIND